MTQKSIFCSWILPILVFSRVCRKFCYNSHQYLNFIEFGHFYNVTDRFQERAYDRWDPFCRSCKRAPASGQSSGFSSWFFLSKQKKDLAPNLLVCTTTWYIFWRKNLTSRQSKWGMYSIKRKFVTNLKNWQKMVNFCIFWVLATIWRLSEKLIDLPKSAPRQ